MGEDRLPINDRMTDCVIERNNNVMDLLLDFRLVKPVNVRERESVAKHWEYWKIAAFW